MAFFNLLIFLNAIVKSIKTETKNQHFLCYLSQIFLSKILFYSLYSKLLSILVTLRFCSAPQKQDHTPNNQPKLPLIRILVLNPKSTIYCQVN